MSGPNNALLCANRKDRLRDAGLCLDCARREAEPGRPRCVRCRELATEQQRRRRAEARSDAGEGA